MIRDESSEDFGIQEDFSSFSGFEPQSSCQGTVINSFQIYPLNKSKGYNTKRGKKASSRREEFEKSILSNIVFLRNLALKFTNHKDDAEDLLQETLLKAYRFFDKYEPNTHPKAWLYRIMKNTHINSYRKSLREIKTEPQEEVEMTDPTMFSEGIKRLLDPSRAFINKSLIAKINESIGKLPEEFRASFLLSIVEGYSYREVAEKLNCPIGTIMSRIHRARKILQKDLEVFSDSYEEGYSFYNL